MMPQAQAEAFIAAGIRAEQQQQAGLQQQQQEARDLEMWRRGGGTGGLRMERDVGDYEARVVVYERGEAGREQAESSAMAIEREEERRRREETGEVEEDVEMFNEADMYDENCEAYYGPRHYDPKKDGPGNAKGKGRGKGRKKKCVVM